MNNLVSKNPILRFKLGKKILKFALGDEIRVGANLGASILGTIPYKYPKKIKTNSDNFNWNWKTGLLDSSSNNSLTIQRKRNWTPEQETAANQWFNDLATGKWKTKVGGTRGTNSGIKSQKSKPTYMFGKMGGWNKSMGNQITDEESLNYLREMGLEGKTAGDILALINNEIGSNSVKVDNKWGNLSRAGLKAYYDRWKAQLVEPSSTITSPSLSPEFKLLLNQEAALENPSKVNSDRYVSVGPYNNQKGSVALKDYGIRDYNSLINYVKNNPNNFLSLDLTHLFGDVNNWNQLNFENTVGIRGHYGRLNRNSLWGYLAGLQNKWNSASYKVGGKLIPRKTVTQKFKSNFRLVAQ